MSNLSGVAQFVQVAISGFRAPAAVAAGLVFCGALALATPAVAQRADAEQLCTPDVMRLCGEFIPDRGKIVACLKRKRFALSPGCRQVFTSTKARPTKAARAKSSKRTARN